MTETKPPARSRSTWLTVDRGASAIEYAGLIVVAALILGALYATGVAGQVTARTSTAVCQVLHAQNCVRPSRPPQAQAKGVEGGSRPAPGDPHDVPRPSPSASPDPHDPTAAVRERTKRLLDMTPTGRAAERYAERHGVKVIYVPGSASAETDADNTIRIGMAQPPALIAAVYVHEVNHARNQNYPSISAPRSVFVDKSVQEEAYGDVLQSIELEELRHRMGANAPADTIMESEYKDGYTAGVSKAEKAAASTGRELTPAQREQAGERGGEAQLKADILSHLFVYSGKGESYMSVYGAEWDDAHKPHHAPKTCSLGFCW